MKGNVIIVISIVLGLVAGFGGGYIASTTHFGSISQNAVPTITNFSLTRSVLEKNGTGGDLFYLNATESGSPYEAGFQVVTQFGNESITLASGTFYGDLHYVYLSFVGSLLLGELGVGNHTITASVFHGDVSNSRSVNLRIIPALSAFISGPTRVNDANGSVTVSFHADVSGGMGPYSYSWSVFNSSYSQQASYIAEDSSSLVITFFLNSQDASFSGVYNGTMTIDLTVTDDLGGSSSPSLNVNLIGN